MNPENSNPLYRISVEAAVLLETLAKAKRFTEPMMIEQLIRQAAVASGIINPDHPEAAYAELVNKIARVAPPEHPDFTCQVFEQIKATPDLKQLYDQAITPLPSQSADKRKLYVNQCLGRFCKKFIGWESDEEVTLAKDRVGLIKGYTRLKPPARLATQSKLSETAERLDEAKQTLEKLDLVISEVTLVRSGC
jgi:hypothetical protein